MPKNTVYIVALLIAIGLVYLHKTKGGIKQIFSPSPTNNFPVQEPEWDKMVRPIELPPVKPEPKIEQPKAEQLPAPKPKQQFPQGQQPFPQQPFPPQQFPQGSLP